jgi:hypothetical protein
MIQHEIDPGKRWKIDMANVLSREINISTGPNGQAQILHGIALSLTLGANIGPQTITIPPAVVTVTIVNSGASVVNIGWAQ